MTLLFFGALAMPRMPWGLCWTALDCTRWIWLWRKRIAGTSFPRSCLATMGSTSLPSKNRGSAWGSGALSHRLHLSSAKPHRDTINIHSNFQILPDDLNCHLMSTSSLIWRGLCFGIVFPSLPSHPLIQIPNHPPSTRQTSLSDTDN